MMLEENTLGELLSNPKIQLIAKDAIRNMDLSKEEFWNKTLKQMKEEQGLPENVFFHYDTPLTVEHEIQVLRQAGFSDVRILKEWGTTFTLIAKR